MSLRQRGFQPFPSTPSATPCWSGTDFPNSPRRVTCGRGNLRLPLRPGVQVSSSPKAASSIFQRSRGRRGAMGYSCGRGVLVWQDPAGLSATALGPGGTWSLPLHLPVAQFRDGPQVGVDGVGNAIVVWTQWDGTRNEVWADRFSPSRGWDAAQRIDTVGNNQGPRIVVDPQGSAFVVWSEFGPPSRISANRFEVHAP
jgi:hypothetical protein